VRKAGLLSFWQDEEPGNRPEYDRRIRSFLHTHSRRMFDIRGDVGDLEGMGADLIAFLEESYLQYGPLTALVDITSCPKYYFLLLLGASLGKGLCAQVDFCYAEGLYELRAREEYVFTRGEWDSVTVPFYPGHFDPEKGLFFLISVGFEGQRALRMVAKYDPDRISIVLPRPGFSEDYTEQAEESSQALIREYRVPDGQVLKVRAGDAIGAWREIDRGGVCRPQAENVAFLCLGTKPHALALGLQALTAPEVSLLYNKPWRFARTDSRFNGNIWLYRIRDLSAV
jgi:hypothetical protein